MASLASMATLPITTPKLNTAFFSPLPKRSAVVGHRINARSVRAQASLKEKVVTGLTAVSLTASMMAPDVAQAAELAPSLKNFLLSITAGGVVLTAIVGAIVVISNFDPVKRV